MGKMKHPLYHVWRAMINRCHNPNFKHWDRYGGRGIKICQRWRDDFFAFVDDMGPRPKGHEIDRIDNDGDYTPDNCRWATRRQQQRNQTITRRVVIEGAEYLAVALADKSGLKTDTIVSRAQKGLSYDEVIDPKPRRNLSGLALGRHLGADATRNKTHCPKGHAYSPENTIISRQGWRRCRKCFYEKERKRRLNKPY